METYADTGGRCQDVGADAEPELAEGAVEFGNKPEDGVEFGVACAVDVDVESGDEPEDG